MHIGSSLVAHLQPPELVQPRQSPFYHPAVPSQALGAVYPFAGNARGDPPLPQCLATGSAGIGFVGMQFGGAFARSTAFPLQGRDRIHQLFQQANVMHIGSGMADYQGNSLSFGHNMALRPRFAAIRRIGPGSFAPRGAGTLAESRLARDQSMYPAWESRSSRMRWSCSHTPAVCQSRNRRQQVIPLPQPSSWGSSSQGIPVRSTNKIPVKAARSGIRGLPPFDLEGSGGRRGWITCQSSSEIIDLAIHQSYQIGFC